MICHDACSTTEPELVETVASAAGLALENERLDAELRARVEELRASRARIVRAADDERRRLERDLHDGAQQRLVALALNLRLARSKLDSDPPAATELLDETAAELGEATDRAARAGARDPPGRAHAIAACARRWRRSPGARRCRSSSPSRRPSACRPRSRPPPTSSSPRRSPTSRSYARATHAAVTRQSRATARSRSRSRDDGVGGADPRAGSGLRGLADRVAALDGRLEVDSPRRRRDRRAGRIPCA